MNPVIPCSTGIISFIPESAFTARRSDSLTTLNLSRKSVKHGSSKPRFLVPPFVSIGLISKNQRILSFNGKSRTSISATETDIAVEEPDSPAANDDSIETSEAPSKEVGTSEDLSLKSNASTASAKAKRSRPARKSEMPPVKNEDLIPGATFSGKVKSIQPFGAFIDFGAFTDGLVHVSRLSDSYVKDVASIVSVGQEVNVKLIEVNTESQRISLSMRESDDIGKLRQQKDAPVSSAKTGPGRRNTSKPSSKKDDVKRSTKFVKGQDLEGTVKNMTRSGAFISLPDGEEGFLPISEESDDGFENVMGNSSLQVGQEVSVRVLRISRGQVTLTMKKEEDIAELDSQLSQGVVHAATNPFVLAFRKNKEIASFLDERDNVKKPVENTSTEEIKETVLQQETVIDVPEKLEEPVKDNLKDDNYESKADVEGSLLDSASRATVGDARNPVSNISDPISGVDAATEKEAVVVTSGGLAAEGDSSTSNQIVEEAAQTDVAASNAGADSPLEIASENVNDKTEKGDSKSLLDAGASSSDGESKADVNNESDAVSNISSSNSRVEGASENKENVTSGILAPERDDASTANQIIEEVTQIDVVASHITDSPPETDSEIVGESRIDLSVVKDEKQLQTSDADEQSATAAPTDNNGVDLSPEINGSIKGLESDILSNNAPTPLEIADDKAGAVLENNSNDISSSGQTGMLSSQESLSTVVENSVNEPNEVQEQAPATENENSFSSQVESKEVKSAPETNNSLSNANGQTGVSASEQGLSKATISPALVKQLREETGAGMMDCKRALSETGGDIIKAQEFLRKKGLASAEKKASRATAEGRIGSYIHDSRIGILVEVNCETDFVSRGEIFKELVDDMAMQVAACPQVQYLDIEDVPESIVNKEKEIEMQKEDLLSKPEQIRAKIVEGRIRKRLEELALLEQPYIKNDKVVVKDLVKQTIATIGENIKVKRFVRFNLGEGLEKKSQDFAAEVAAQTAAKAVPAPEKTEPTPAAKEPEQKPLSVAVSAALVKQLREDTGAGMMDCKKALAETGGDLEKAQEYLRKKGLSSAEKKSSRLAAEGRIGSYIHDSRIGVLIEVNCETDFVGRSDKFKELVDDLAMQVVASPQVQFVSVEDIPESIVNKEKEIEMQRDDILSKPENIRERIVEGRVSKRLGELALLEQPFIKDDNVLVKDFVKQTVAAIGENIKVRRFVRFTLGETAQSETTIPSA
ncbi:polyprotein of EF-Ts, chloroplastic isoform X1 [Prosopis cineraria]|uniref:polyprotein of EF-Ts, chloroplastic isoform X1 n=1 Tax=Prosopis cineraria TaxID=364024 RepID=UPI00240FE378|nr:polyprotein of EF-Ts, chloroplastic isoform X1 [Prosopis cineraria]XP_054787504.1 polyprotein of EF-Ts, chloroplastic isoform X1 [Prosopis cineraria]XP_054787505.1 polyprotein of EF-Ts, chloroplastic isoform X1 [Prosopis cineraria]